MKQKAVISCRPDKTFMARFMDAVQTLGVTDSVLSRRALELGLEKAAKEIAADKRKEAQATLNRLKDSRVSFESPEFLSTGPVQLEAA